MNAPAPYLSRYLSRLFALSAIIVSVGCSSLSGTSTLPLPTDTDTTLSLQQNWSAQTSSSSVSAIFPSVLGRTLYVANATGTVQAINTNTGHTDWVYRAEKPLQGTLSSDADLLLMSTQRGDLIALDSSSGRFLWQKSLNRRISGSIQFAGDTLIAWSEDAGVIALSKKDGAEKWVHDFPSTGLLINGARTGILALGAIFTGTPKGKLSVIDIRTGQLYWETSLLLSNEKVDLNPMIDASTTQPIVNSTLACASTAQRTACLDRTKGSVIWNQPYGTLTGLESDGLNLFGFTPEGRAYALQAHSGKRLWEYNGLLSTPALKPELMKSRVWIAPTQYPLLIQLDADTGRYQKVHPLPAPAQWMKALDDNTLIVQTRDGYIYRYTLNDSSLSHGVSRQ